METVEEVDPPSDRRRERRKSRRLSLSATSGLTAVGAASVGAASGSRWTAAQQLAIEFARADWDAEKRREAADRAAAESELRTSVDVLTKELERVQREATKQALQQKVELSEILKTADKHIGDLEDQTEKLQDLVIKRSVALWTSKLGSSIFARWLQFTHASRDDRSCMRGVVVRMKNAVLRRGFIALLHAKDASEHADRVAQIATRMLRRALHATIAMGWTGWTAFARVTATRRRGLAVATAKRHRRWLRLRWTRWRAFRSWSLARGLALRRAARIGQRTGSDAVCNAAFARLFAHVQRVRLAESRDAHHERLIAHQRNRKRRVALRQEWERWVRTVAQLRRSRRITTRGERRRALACLRAWRTLVASRILANSIALKVMERADYCTVAQGLALWRTRTRFLTLRRRTLARTMHASSRRARAADMASVFRRFAHARRDFEVRLRGKARLAAVERAGELLASRRRLVRARAGVRRWAVYVAQLQHKRGLLSACVERFQGCTGGWWKVWRAYVAGRRLLRRAISGMLATAMTNQKWAMRTWLKFNRMRAREGKHRALLQNVGERRVLRAMRGRSLRHWIAYSMRKRTARWQRTVMQQRLSYRRRAKFFRHWLMALALSQVRELHIYRAVSRNQSGAGRWPNEPLLLRVESNSDRLTDAARRGQISSDHHHHHRRRNSADADEPIGTRRHPRPVSLSPNPAPAARGRSPTMRRRRGGDDEWSATPMPLRFSFESDEEEEEEEEGGGGAKSDSLSDDGFDCMKTGLDDDAAQHSGVHSGVLVGYGVAGGVYSGDTLARLRDEREGVERMLEYEREEHARALAEQKESHAKASALLKRQYAAAVLELIEPQRGMDEMPQWSPPRGGRTRIARSFGVT